MSCRSLLYCHNSNLSVETGGNISLGNVVRRFGKFVNQSGDGALAEESGYFTVNADFTITPDAVGTVTVSALVNGVEITSGSTYASVATTPVNISLDFVVRNSCCGDSSTILFNLVSGGGTVNVADVVIERM